MTHPAVTPLDRVSAVDELAAALRARILDGDLRAGLRLPEQELCTTYLVARHTARAALRALAAEGLVVIEPHRGASVTALGPAEVEGLYELRVALEVEAARLALERHDGSLPQSVHAAVTRLGAVCARRRAAWSSVVDAHENVHAELVAASQSPRLIAAHEALAGESRLFIVQVKLDWTLEKMASDHERLLDELEDRGTDALREHLRESADSVLAHLRSGA